MGRPNLFGMGRDALAAVVAERGEPAFRARQVYGWLYHRRVREVGAMANLPKPLRAALAQAFDLRWPEVAERALSFDGTRKYLFRLDDGATIEAVYIPEDDRRTICISTQAGCPLKCAFCLTGIAGYKRNLKPWEILGQVATVMEDHPAAETHPRRREDDPFPWNVVVMGMGEPLLNYEATVEALRVLMELFSLQQNGEKQTSVLSMLILNRESVQLTGTPNGLQVVCMRGLITLQGKTADYHPFIHLSKFLDIPKMIPGTNITQA